jgi:ribosomal-protein-alanine N-acetyltransferase
MSAMVPLTLAHAPVLAALHRHCFDEPWDDAAMAGVLAMPGAFGYLSPAADGMPAGFILCRTAADEAEIMTLMVIPALRRQGMGERLLTKAQSHAAAHGAVVMFLEVASNNNAAKALYESNGFIEVGRRARYYANGADALILEAKLS